VRKRLPDHRRPQHLLVAPVEETGPEPEVELGDDAPDIGLLAFPAKLGARLLERIDFVPVVDDLDVVEPVSSTAPGHPADGRLRLRCAQDR
jgi:hypothetical protein